jgi:hypothetical protein
MIEGTGKKTSPALIAAAWAVVSIPLVWGIYNTGLNAAKLFTVGQAAVTAAPVATTPTAR